MATRPILLSAIFTAILTAGSASAFAAEEQPQVENAKFQFAGVVNADAVLVRSGPGDNYYITAKLPKGTPVTVVGIKFEWLKIAPPEGSFSVVAKNYIIRDGNSAVGHTNADNVNIRAGSSVVPLKVTVQCKLPRGAEVQIVGEDDAYYQIKPPADAYLYVNQKFVEPVKQVAAAAPAKPIERPIEKKEEPKKTDDANIELVKTLRETLGSQAEIMFDAFQGWSLDYAIQWAKAVEQYRPRWIEEAFHMDKLESFVALRKATSVPVATGEHIYGRWEVHRFLSSGAITVVQADPEWCGGTSELVKICTIASAFDAQVIPHGHSLYSALHVVASQSPMTCPLVEYLVGKMASYYHFEKEQSHPVNGKIALPKRPGFGIEIDPAKAEKQTLATWA